MLSRLLQQASNFTAVRRLAAIACLVALCGVVFGVGAAFGRPGARRAMRPAARAVAAPRHVRQARHGRPALRHGMRRAYKRHNHKRLYMRRMAAHAARDRHARRRHRLAVRAARRHAGKHGRAQRRLKHALMMRDTAPTKAHAPRAHGTATPTAGAAGVTMPLVNSGTVPAAAAASTPTRLNPTLTGSSTGQLDVIASRVRAVAVRSQAATYAPRSAAPAHAPAARKPVHHGSKLGGGFTFPFMPQPGQIEHFVNVIPQSIWLALASAFALAGLGGAAAVRSGRRARRQASEFAAVAAVALTDPLTGVLNRRGFVEAVERELARARRYESPFVLAYIDVRGLKAVNDSEGHLVGDEVIKHVAQLLGESVRAEDAVGRLGGDELALLLAGQSAQSAEAVIERIQDHVPGCREAMGTGTDWGLTIGTAAYPADGATFDELVSTADRRLYEQRGIRLR